MSTANVRQEINSYRLTKELVQKVLCQLFPACAEDAFKVRVCRPNQKYVRKMLRRNRKALMCSSFLSLVL